MQANEATWYDENYRLMLESCSRRSNLALASSCQAPEPQTRLLNRLRLWRFAFHPILVFRKPAHGQP